MPIVINEIEIAPEPPPAGAVRSPGPGPAPAGKTPELSPLDLWEIQRRLAERAERVRAD